MWTIPETFILVTVAASTIINGTRSTEALLKLSVFYETLCPDSIAFIANQLTPTYKLIGNDIQVDLVPYGFETKTKQSNGSYSFACQHGPRECYGNKVHGCAINLYNVEESTEFVQCSMSSLDPASLSILKQCATKSGISWTSIDKCLTSGQAEKIQLLMGKRTAELNPQFIPTVVFNDSYNDTLQNEAMSDLLGVVCKLLDFEPDGCHSVFRRIVEEEIVVKLID